MTPRPLIALISATPAAIAPAETGLTRGFPRAAAWHLLDDRLLTEAAAAGGTTPRLEARMRRLIDHALHEKADGVLLTCSLYGAVARTADAAGVPVLAPDDAAFTEALGGGHARILLVASFAAALSDAASRLHRARQLHGSATDIRTVVADGALDATRAADADALAASLEGACRAHSGTVDAVLLAQFSLAPAATRLSAALGLPVISGPDAAARHLRALIERRDAS
ncbi:aspartate/glutamate racemase family protein [Streptomyces pinistramenti]|uniref:aspartate/glutamate racemase family protein n=1 Tax=Streptomyces pinistramenti TaxID=2884812 RepID=UPI001D07B02D|nr:aspartate/glutamate racemase family protein [Streptomyces pinistramenti]MCB5906534.1 aspartate/glutamate racemase family protein [Streptomyces pinistramenti]